MIAHGLQVLCDVAKFVLVKADHVVPFVQADPHVVPQLTVEFVYGFIDLVFGRRKISSAQRVKALELSCSMVHNNRLRLRGLLLLFNCRCLQLE